MSDSAKAEVMANLERAVEHYNGKNVEPFVECFTSDFTIFNVMGNLLNEDAMDASTWQAAFDAGLAPNVSPRHVNIEIYGDTALLTCYMAGTITRSGGETEQGPWRVSAVYTREGDGWKARHNHWSKLLPGS